MAIARPMTDTERKTVALEYLKAFDNAGVTDSGGSILELFAEDAQVYFPKWGVAKGRDEIGRMFGDVGGTLKSILHDYDAFNYVMTGTDTFAIEWTSVGDHRDGSCKAGEPEHGPGRWCDGFEVRAGRNQRCSIYPNPTSPGKATVRNPC